MNRILYADDCLNVLNDADKLPDESVDLIYLDPPFNSNSNYNLPFKGKDKSTRPVEAFTDTWRWQTADDEGLEELHANPMTRNLATVVNFAQGTENPLGGGGRRTSLAAYLLKMAGRLLAMRRVLKETGSIYLHCDPTASHYLKLIMDAVYGRKNFRNEIIWRRHAHSHSLGAKQWPVIHDVLLMYSKSSSWTWNTQYEPYSEEYIKKSFRYNDARGPYQAYPITGARPGGAESYAAWKDNTPSIGRAWALPRHSLLPSWLDLPSEEKWRELGIHAKLDKLDELGMIHWPKKQGGQPTLKRYLMDAPGKIIEGLWTKIGISVGANERLGYPTQKPLALLERIIRASSKEGDLVLDPFCGCGTTVQAAESLKRRWIGIDISPFSTGLIRERIVDQFEHINKKDIDVVGVPHSVDEARALAARDKFEFEKWVCGHIGAAGMFREPGEPGADGGVDGLLEIYPIRLNKRAKTEYAIVQVKGGSVSPDAVKALYATVKHFEVTAGVLVCFEDQLGTVANQRSKETFADSLGVYPVIQGYSIRELLANQPLQLPMYGARRQGAKLL